ncbi:MAG: T9SS type A sorting domain-containing protein, partial [Chitinophagaceae bacterium]
YLYDKQLQKLTAIKIGAITPYAFTVNTATPASFSDRFSIVFQPSVLPLNSIQLSGIDKGTQIDVNWQTIGEVNLTQYEVQRSADGSSYQTIGNVAAKNTATASYSFTDAAPNSNENYYRIKVNGVNESSSYSNVWHVKRSGGVSAKIVLYPNPFAGKRLQIQMSQVAAGKYELELTDATGKRISSKEIVHTGGNANNELILNQALAGGTYFVQLRNKASNEAVYSTTLIAQP